MPSNHWSPEQARKFGRLGAQARWSRPRRKPAAPAIQPEPIAADAFRTSVLARVRARIESLLDLLEEQTNKSKPDGAQVDRLASALERLAELERVLDGRPLPGSRRPGRDNGRPAPPLPAR